MSKAKVVERELLIPFIAITSLFFLWGVANDMTNPLVSAFKKVMPELSNTQAAFVQLAFYGGYGTMALPAALFIYRYSYKKGVLVGLALYAIGALLFFPAAQFENYNYFLASLYILTFGLAFLETTANPFILFLGKPETATRRLNLAQAFNPMGSLCGMLIAQLYIVGLLQSDNYTPSEYDMLSAAEKAAIRTHDLGLISVPYIGLGVVIIIVLAAIAMIRMPVQKHDISITVKESFRKLFRNKRYYEGVIAQAFYVGAQISCWTFIYHYVDHLNASRPADAQLTATWYNMAAMIIFLSSRWISTFLMKYIEPARLMFYFAVGGIMLALGAISIVGMAGLYCLVGISAMMSLMFPTIYGIALDGMGEEAKIGSAGLVMAIVGGALLPPFQGRILDMGGDGLADLSVFGYIPEVNFSFVLPMASFVVVALYAYRSFKSYMQP